MLLYAVYEKQNLVPRGTVVDKVDHAEAENDDEIRADCLAHALHDLDGDPAGIPLSVTAHVMLVNTLTECGSRMRRPTDLCACWSLTQ